jgi:hypothetical protein
MMTRQKYWFAARCDDFTIELSIAPAGLSDMIESKRTISRRTFLAHTDKAEIETIAMNLGYEKNAKRGLTMAGDCYITYWRSSLFGRVVYGFDWSAYEYIFTQDGSIVPAKQARVE